MERGQRKKSWSVGAGTTTIGRDVGNQIRLADSSVSRQHAEIKVGDGGVIISDLKSLNGVIVNDAPRKRAVLQAGDTIKIGIFQLILTAASSASSIVTSEAPGGNETEGPTIDKGFQLPEGDRELHTLYHFCFWLTDELDPAEFTSKCVRLLVDSFQAQEVHLYGSDCRVDAFSSRDGAKAAIRLAPFLAKQFQQSVEPVFIPGKSIAQHQQRIGNYNYLVGPLRPSGSAEAQAPFLVMVRPTDWNEFSSSDRTLLSLICKLWVRGQARAIQVQDLRKENAQLKQKVGVPTLLGAGPKMVKLREEAKRVAETNLTVLLQGETGSGKEVVAHFVHANSQLKEQPFVKINCAAVPEALIESELFGHVRGSFTGAVADRKGRFAQADQGTIFLDEVAEMPLTVQAKVLRAIEQGEIQPVGSEKTITIKVRIIAATHRDLGEMVRQKLFRQDLAYRLAVKRLTVPPLREHPEDIDELAYHFLTRFCADNGLAEMNFAPEALAKLRSLPWPGNIRELRNIVQCCAAAAEGPVISVQVVEEQVLSTFSVS